VEYFLGSSSWGPLGPFSYYNSSRTVTVPSGVPPGYYFVSSYSSSDDYNGNRASWSFQQIYVDCAPLGAVALSSPPNGASCRGTTLTLYWNTTAGADLYRLRIGSSCGTGLTYTTTGTSYTVTLSPGSTYYWQVQARNECGDWGPYSSCRAVSTAPLAPPAPTLLSPPDGAGAEPLSGTLDWSSVSGAVSYHLYVRTSDGSPVIQVEVPTSFYDYSLDEGTYHWSVRAERDCSVIGPSSPTWTFTVQDITAAPDDAAAAAPTSVTLEPPVGNPTHGRLQVRFGLPRPAVATVAVFDVAGRKVAELLDENRDAGWHDLSWDGRGEDGRRVPQGVYLLRLESGGEVSVQRSVLLR
jgi:hypothetical protein